jgi:glycosyltransferase involved in cell wall biosynthesis
MGASRSPLVSVVIPVYNGQEVIAEAIRSVLAQTYDNFHLTIANNCSTDRTAQIAEEFAAQDDRVTVYNATEFVSVVGSHNRAFTLIAEDAKYCKILGADDWLLPNCLAELVRVAEAYPTIGMVTSYVQTNLGEVLFDGLPYPSTFLSGRDACRAYLLRGVYAFGGPSTSLIRAEILRETRPFYNPLNYHGDVEAYLNLLQKYDFGFVHQVLSFICRGEKSGTTAFLDRVNSYRAEAVDELTRFGPAYLTTEEQHRRLRQAWHEYYKMLAEGALSFQGKEFWDYHLRGFLPSLGYSISRARIAGYVVLGIADKIFNPLRSTQHLMRRLSRASKPAEKPAPVRTAPVMKPLTR